MHNSCGVTSYDESNSPKMTSHYESDLLTACIGRLAAPTQERLMYALRMTEDESNADGLGKPSSGWGAAALARVSSQGRVVSERVSNIPKAQSKCLITTKITRGLTGVVDGC